MSKITEWLFRISAVVVIMLGLKFAADLITQILIMIFIAVIISPIYYWLKKHKVPNWASLLGIIVSMVCFTFFGVLGFVTQAIQKFADKMPDYYKQFMKIVSLAPEVL